jgi:hypothetical protein
MTVNHKSNLSMRDVSARVKKKKKKKNYKPRDLLKPLAFRAQTYCGMPATTRQFTAECQLLGKI